MSPQPETPSSYPELPPSDASFLLAMDDDRVSQLERVVVTLQARDIDTQNKLDHLIASLIRKHFVKNPRADQHYAGCFGITQDAESEAG